jgi:hypothetical protein
MPGLFDSIQSALGSVKNAVGAGMNTPIVPADRLGTVWSPHGAAVRA